MTSTAPHDGPATPPPASTGSGSAPLDGPARTENRYGFPSALARRLRRLRDDGILIASGWVLGVAGFVLVVAGLSAAAGLLVAWVGVLVAAGTLLGARGLAHVQRGQLRHRSHRSAPDPDYLRAGPETGRLRRALTPLRDPQSWLDAAWAVLAFVTGTVALVVSVSWCAATAGGLTYWLWQRWLPAGNVGPAELLGWADRRGDGWLYLVAGVAALALLPWVVRACALLHGGVADLLLCSRARWQTQVQRVTHSRSAARHAEAHSLRRLERDLHDGPQQGMVRLTMDIGRARRQLDTDPQRARTILDDALVRARGTTEELRALSRGIAPPLLVDRGLRAAIEELLQRSPIPASSRVDVPGDLAPHLETAVYFTVAEALTNVAKHSGAGQVSVTVETVSAGAGAGTGTGSTGTVTGTAGSEVVASVVDDGVGGAHLAKGSGLAGLAQRLAGVDGRLTVSSPPGGPTSVVAVVPLDQPTGARALREV